MKNTKLTVVLVALLFGFINSFASEILKPSQLLQGRIVGDDGTPLVGVNVSVSVLHNASPIATDSNGYFELLVPLARYYALTASKTGLYNSFHTFLHTDLARAGDSSIGIPTIVMVEKKYGRVMLALGGDTMLARRYLAPLTGEPQLIRRDSQKSDMQSLLRFVKSYLELADFTSLNLETQLIDGDVPARTPKSVTFYTHPDIVPVLQNAGVDYVALGNNHTFDYGEKGLRSTLKTLDDYGMQYSGAGINETEARRPLSVEIGGSPFNFLSYVGWSGNFEPNQVAETDKGGAALGLFNELVKDVASLPEASTTILQVHSGLEYKSRPSLSETTRYKGAIDAGADLVVGHHPHVLQGMDLYNGRLIAYSLGNFLFDQYIYATQLSMILYVWMDGDQFFRAEIVPLFLNGYVPTPANGEIQFDILQRLMHLSDQTTLHFASSGAHAVLVPRKAAVEYAHLNATGVEKGVVTHLKKLGASPLKNVAALTNTNGAYRLGVDLIKRGTFETSGEHGIIDRTWLTSKNVVVAGDENRHLRISGVSRTGMRTFDRVFSVSNPATLSAKVTSTGSGNIIFYLQRRNLVQSRQNALKDGVLYEIGRLELEPGKTGPLNLDFNMPRGSSKGVRLLIDVQQPEDAVVEIDDLTWVEWRTPWINPAKPLDSSLELQATHFQIQQSSDL